MDYVQMSEQKIVLIIISIVNDKTILGSSAHEIFSVLWYRDNTFLPH